MATKDVIGLLKDVKEDQTDFQNAKALGIDFKDEDGNWSGSWSMNFIEKCAADGKTFLYMDLVIDFLCGAKLGTHGIMSKSRAQLLRGFALALSQVKRGEIDLGEIKLIKY
jgi:hypothetical protein